MKKESKANIEVTQETTTDCGCSTGGECKCLPGSCNCASCGKKTDSNIYITNMYSL